MKFGKLLENKALLFFSTLSFFSLLVVILLTVKLIQTQSRPREKEEKEKISTVAEPKERPKKYEASLEVGSKAKDYLAPSPYKKILIEIDYAPGFPPSEVSKNHLVRIIKKYTREKEVFFAGGNEIEDVKDVYTKEDLLEILKKNRQNFTEGETASLYFLYLNGDFEDLNLLGFPLDGSSAAIFKEKVQKRVGLVTAVGVEKTVLIHELGCLWSLVNVGYESKINHEDKYYPHFCVWKTCAMHYLADTIWVTDLLFAGPPDDFCPDCQFDLEKLRVGEY